MKLYRVAGYDPKSMNPIHSWFVDENKCKEYINEDPENRAYEVVIPRDSNNQELNLI